MKLPSVLFLILALLFLIAKIHATDPFEEQTIEMIKNEMAAKQAESETPTEVIEVPTEFVVEEPTEQVTEESTTEVLAEEPIEVIEVPTEIHVESNPQESEQTQESADQEAATQSTEEQTHTMENNEAVSEGHAETLAESKSFETQTVTENLPEMGDEVVEVVEE